MSAAEALKQARAAGIQVGIDGDLPRDQAEARAFSCCVGEWLHRNPVRPPSGRCERCGRSKGMLLPYLTGYSSSDPGHTWLDQGCSPAWHHARKAKAVSALLEMGISVPVRLTDNFGAGKSK
jgi:hypothetical protein